MCSRPSPLQRVSAANKTYKEQKEESRKTKAGDSAGWNASFVRSDTVVDALADRLGVDKSDILDREEVSYSLTMQSLRILYP